MRPRLWLAALVIALGGCASASLPYKPESPPSGAALSADYTLLADRLRVEIDTSGYRLEDAQIVTATQKMVRPQTIEQPPVASPSSGIGIGIGGSTGGGVGVGTGVGVSIPMGSGTRVQGNTVLYFALDQIGPAPWRLSVKVSGTNPAVIVLPPRSTGRARLNQALRNLVNRTNRTDSIGSTKPMRTTVTSRTPSSL